MQTEQIALLKEIRDLLTQLVAQGKPAPFNVPIGGGTVLGTSKGGGGPPEEP